MAENAIIQKFLSDSRQAQADMARMEARMRKLEAAASRVNKRTKQGQQGFQAGLGRQLAGLKSMVAGYLSVHAAIGLAIRAHKDLATLQEKRLQTKVSAGQSIEKLRLNFLADDSIKTEKQLVTRVREIADKRNAPVEVVAGAAGAALSAKGDATNAQALDALDTVLRITNDPEFVAAATPGVLDIQKFTGEKDPRKILGFLRQTQVKARITQPAKLAQNLPTVIASEKALGGGTAEQAAELFAFLTGETPDETGDVTRTGTANLIRRLKEFAPKRKFKTKKDGITQIDQKTNDDFDEQKTTQDRIAFLQQNPKLAQQFLESQPLGKGQLRGAITLLLKADAGSVGRYKDIQQAILSPSDKNDVKSSLGELLCEGSTHAGGSPRN